MSLPSFSMFLERSLRNQAAFCQGAVLVYVCMDWRHMEELLAAGRAINAELLNLCVWAKDNGGMGSLYRSQHELVFVFKTGSGPHRNNVQLGRFDRNRSNLWQYPGLTPSRARPEEGNLLAALSGCRLGALECGVGRAGTVQAGPPRWRHVLLSPTCSTALRASN